MNGPLLFDLTPLSADLPAKVSASRDSEKAWTIRVLNCPSSMWRLLQSFAPAGWCMRTSPAFFQATAEPTLQRFWQLSQAGKFECLKTVGAMPDISRESRKPMESPGECSTLNLPEYHSAAVASSLSDILETGDVPRRYYLSATACKGILRRAERRGKELPAQLRHALESVARKGAA